MPKTSLNVKPSYCPRWTMQHAVREVIQNAQDCKNLGGTAEYTHRGDTLTVTSTGGGSLDERALVFGETSKADNARSGSLATV
jgi:HD-like signal output (HDOD) protein